MDIIQFRRVSNRADWSDTYELVDETTGEAITDLSDLTIKLQVRKDNSLYLSAQSGDGHITNDAFGVITIAFDATEMAGLEAGTYDIGMTIERDGVTEQQFVGSLPVVEGVAR